VTITGGDAGGEARLRRLEAWPGFPRISTRWCTVSMGKARQRQRLLRSLEMVHQVQRQGIHSQTKWLAGVFGLLFWTPSRLGSRRWPAEL